MLSRIKGVLKSLRPPKLSWKESEEVFAFFDEADSLYQMFRKYYFNEINFNQILAEHLREKFFFDAVYVNDNGNEPENINLTPRATLYGENIYLSSPYDRGCLFETSYSYEASQEVPEVWNDFLEEILEKKKAYSQRMLKKVRDSTVDTKLVVKIAEELDEKILTYLLEKYSKKYIDYVRGSDIDVTPRH